MPTQKVKSEKVKIFKVGDRVILKEFNVLGTVVHISNPKEISVLRDDGDTGSGYARSWLVAFDGKSWTSDCELIIPEVEKIQNVDLAHLRPLVIAEEMKKEIIAVLKQHEHTKLIFDDWGLGETIKYGKGMTMLFHGGPGTGKTWAAHCIAKALSKEIMSVGSAELQSYMAGETQKNIQKAFQEAKSSKKLLFLDECDSLITSRNDVGMIISSEINTLLTEIEKFDGVCILATNRIDTLDDALERRLSLILEFPEPGFSARAEIWTHLIPSKMPLGKDVSIDKLAEFALTGGQIKNAVLQAARFAAADGLKSVPMDAFDRGIKRILESKDLMGKRSRKRQAREDYILSSETR